MTILITGGAGFIGKHLVNKLSKNNKVYVIDKKKFNFKNKNVKFILGDITKINSFKIPSKIETIYHLAAQTSAQISEENPDKDVKTNIMGTYNICKFAIKKKIKQIIFTSSMAVYGEVENKISENKECNPKSMYGMSKLFCEKLIKNLSYNKINFKIFRLFNVYGPGQDLKNFKQGMVSICLAQLIKFKNIIVKGSLDRYRDFIYIDDVVNILTKSNIIQNEIYNLGSGKKTTVRELLKLIKKITNTNFKIIVKKNTQGDIFGSCADVSKLNKIMNLDLKYNIKSGLFRTIKSITK